MQTVVPSSHKISLGMSIELLCDIMHQEKMNGWVQKAALDTQSKLKADLARATIELQRLKESDFESASQKANLEVQSRANSEAHIRSNSIDYSEAHCSTSLQKLLIGILHSKFQ
jgi:hypothetical protein